MNGRAAELLTVCDCAGGLRVDWIFHTQLQGISTAQSRGGKRGVGGATSLRYARNVSRGVGQSATMPYYDLKIVTLGTRKHPTKVV
jgi:hypothetical protein